LLSQLGIEASPAVHYAIAFAIIFVLLTLFALVLRRLTGGRSMLSGQGGRTRQPRLGIVDVYDLDRQRQLILLRRDNVEHLLLIGGPNDVVVESNIVRVPGARLPAHMDQGAERLDAAIERGGEALANRPVLETLPTRPAPEPAERPRPPSPEPMERPRPAPEPVPVQAALQPSAIRAETVLKPDVVAGPAEAMALPSEPVPPPRRPPLRAEPRPAATPPLAPGANEQAPAPDAAILSDMARQLEEALKRPIPAVKPAEARPPAPPEPAAVPPRPAAPRPAPVPAAPRPAPPPLPRAAAPPMPAPAGEPAPPPAAEPSVPAKPSPAPSPSRVNDPFSVEEIEAEFARLLGRPTDKNEKSGT
jgi:flagellar protein FliO/FliZ